MLPPFLVKVIISGRADLFTVLRQVLVVFFMFVLITHPLMVLHLNPPGGGTSQFVSRSQSCTVIQRTTADFQKGVKTYAKISNVWKSEGQADGAYCCCFFPGVLMHPANGGVLLRTAGQFPSIICIKKYMIASVSLTKRKEILNVLFMQL